MPVIPLTLHLYSSFSFSDISAKAAYGYDDFFYVLIRHGGVKGEGEGFEVVGFGVGAFALGVSVGFLIPGLQVDGDVEHLGADALLSEFPHDFDVGFAEGGEVDLDGVEMEGG